MGKYYLKDQNSGIGKKLTKYESREVRSSKHDSLLLDERMYLDERYDMLAHLTNKFSARLSSANKDYGLAFVYSCMQKPLPENCNVHAAS